MLPSLGLPGVHHIAQDQGTDEARRAAALIREVQPPRFRREPAYPVAMVQRQKWIEAMHAAHSTLLAAGLGLAVLAALTLPADARGGHGFGRGFGGHGIHGAQFAGDRRHGNDAYIKAASDERNKLLNTQIKSICRGC
jgi:hypothetical protein